MKKRTLLMISVLALIVFLDRSYASGQTSEIEQIKQRGVLRVAMFKGERYPFFYFNSKKQLTGIDVDIAKRIAKELGVSLKINRQNPTFDDTIESIASGNADLAISKLSQTLSRAEKVRFTRPYFTIKKSVLVNRLRLSRIKGQKPALEKINQSSAEIAVLKGSAYLTFLKKDFDKAKIKIFSSLDSMFQAVTKGKVTAIYIDEFEIKKYLHKHPDHQIYVETHILGHHADRISIAIPKNSHHFENWLNLFIEELTSSRVVEKIISNHTKARQS